jgi:hypothetical protein
MHQMRLAVLCVFLGDRLRRVLQIQLAPCHASHLLAALAGQQQ